MNWADRLEKDVAAKERDTEALKQEHQRDTSRLKVSGPPLWHLPACLHSCLAADKEHATLLVAMPPHAQTAPGTARPGLAPLQGANSDSSPAGRSAGSSLLSMVHIWRTEFLLLQACLKDFSAKNQSMGGCKRSSGL